MPEAETGLEEANQMSGTVPVENVSGIYDENMLTGKRARIIKGNFKCEEQRNVRLLVKAEESKNDSIR